MKQSRIDFALKVVRACLLTLSGLDSASPDEPQIHVILSMLDSLARAPFDAEETDEIIARMKDGGELAKLRDLLAHAEHENEHCQAAAMLSQGDINYDAQLKSIYAALVGSELDLIRQHSKGDLKSCVFVGCGALPLTPLLISQLAGIKVRALDNHAGCLAIGRKIVQKFDRAGDISFIRAQGEAYDYANAPLVYVAAMVPDKLAVMAQIAKTAPDALVVTRGGLGLREIFYEPVDVDAFETVGWKCLKVSPPPKMVRNTSYLFVNQTA